MLVRRLYVERQRLEWGRIRWSELFHYLFNVFQLSQLAMQAYSSVFS